jgi:hypothetical protein
MLWDDVPEPIARELLFLAWQGPSGAVFPCNVLVRSLYIRLRPESRHSASILSTTQSRQVWGGSGKTAARRYFAPEAPMFATSSTRRKPPLNSGS